MVDTKGKGIGKEYNSSDFSKPPKEVGGSKLFLYVGVGVLALVIIVGGLFLLNNVRQSKAFIGAAVINAYCVDSDGGYNRYTRGVTAGTSAVDYGESEWVDKCAGEENKLTEYYCKNKMVAFTTEPCPEAMLCQEGICL